MKSLLQYSSVSTMAQIHLTRTLLSHLLLTFLSLSTAAHIPAVIVFGDSTVDPGNNNAIPTILRSDFPPYGRDFQNGKPTGRFCNGRLPTDFISEALGLPPLVPAYLDPAYGIEDFAKGVSFASAGTGLDNATSDVLAVIPLWKEVEYFKEYQKKLRKYVGEAHAEYIVNEAIYIISIGTNDFLENYFAVVTGRILQLPVDKFEDFLVSQAAEFLTNIYRLGARKISFAGLSPIGCLPLERTTNVIGKGGCNEKYNRVARDFNAKLQRMIADLCTKLPGLRLRYSGVYDRVLQLINNPSHYGLENVEEGCCGTGKFEMGFLCDSKCPLTCPDANKYLFWDAFHPTEKVNRLMAGLTLSTGLREFI
ncbi:GDSL esterase/lipase [Rhynchospora pubera]|uniref:GDSL esterase/lipase n=1 Tax=Rhynchospora pubera TaxID=906938 RepID=A0AAV8G553_9POAL|nr:GDSL esterase/lipase [Rhynchospora pubera]